MSASNNSAGFSLPELLIALTVFGFLSISVLAISTNFLVTITRNSITTDMTAESQNLLRIMTEEIRYGAGVRQTNTIIDPNAPGGAWNTSNTNFVIIVAVPSFDSNNQYIIDSSTGEPYMNELVYYRMNDVLLKRVLAHPNAIGNRLKTSCPPSGADTSCPPDRELIRNAGAMDFTLYDQNDAITTNALLARSVAIRLQMERQTFGDPITLTNNIRVTLRNEF